jgi:hypothetical protein
MATLLLLFVFQVKHFVLDFLYQPPYQWKNKGTFGHPGGILHAGQHAVMTFCLLLGFTGGSLIALWLALAEFVAHYLIDWGKMNLNKKMGWGPTTHEQFWQLLGFDQLLHQLIYLGIVLILSTQK